MFKRNPQCIIHFSTESGNQPISIYEKKFIIGRKATHLVSIPDNSISRDHVEVIIKDDEAFVKDLGTSNGTKIDGRQISPQIPFPLREGQILQLGHSEVGLTIELMGKDKEKRRSTPHSSTGHHSHQAYTPHHQAPAPSYRNDPARPELPSYEQPQNHEPPAYEPPAYEPAYEPPPYQPPEPVARPAYQPPPPVVEERPRPAPFVIPQPTAIAESHQHIPGNNEEEILQHARDEGNRILARSKVEAEMHIRELLRSRETEAQNIIHNAEDKAAQKIRDAEAQVAELLRHNQTQAADSLRAAQNQAQEIVRGAQTQSDMMLKEAQNQTQSYLSRAEGEAVQLKDKILEDGRREKQRIVEDSYRERERVLQETEVLKQMQPELHKQIDALKLEIDKYYKNRTELEADYNTQKQKIQEAVEQHRHYENQLQKINDQYKQVQKQIELGEERFRATQASAQTLMQETQETQARVNKREAELHNLIETAKIQKEESDKYSILTRKDAEMYGMSVKQEADKYSMTTHQDADKYLNNTKLDADRYSATIKQDADKYSANTRQDADKYSATNRADSDQYANTTRTSADKYAKVTKEETDGEIVKKLDYLKAETEKILAERDRLFHDMKSKQEAVLHELKQSEESKLNQISEIDKLLQNKKALMEKEIAERIAAVNAEVNKAKADLDAEYNELKAAKERDHQELVANRDREYKDMRLQQDTFLNDMRRAEEDKIRRMLEESTKMIKTQREQKITQVTSSLEHFFNELQKHASGDIIDHIPLLKDNLSKLMRETLTNEYAGEENKLRQILDYNPEIANAHKKFWKKAAIGGAIAAAILGYILYNPAKIGEIPEQMQKSVDEIDRANKKIIQQQQEAIRLQSIYRPDQDTNFKENYTDNVLFTKNYTSFEMNEAARKDWSVKLNHFLLEKVGIKDDEAIQFIANEASLVRNLETKKALIDGKNPEVGIKTMRSLEDEYQKLIQNTLKDHVQEFWTMKKELFTKFMQENEGRIPATDEKH